MPTLRIARRHRGVGVRRRHLDLRPVLSVVLSPFPMTLAQTLDIANLRYEYAVQASA